VLSQFPTVDPAVVKHWDEVNSGAPIEATSGTATAKAEVAEETEK
jgi:hypothetical protein